MQGLEQRKSNASEGNDEDLAMRVKDLMSEVYFEIQSRLEDLQAEGEQMSELIPRQAVIACIRSTIKRATIRMLAAPSTDDVKIGQPDGKPDAYE